MNKKGVLGTFTVALIIAGVMAGLAFLLGIGWTLKVVSIIKSIPTIGWVGIGIFLIFLMLRGKK